MIDRFLERLSPEGLRETEVEDLDRAVPSELEVRGLESVRPIRNRWPPAATL